MLGGIYIIELNGEVILSGSNFGRKEKVKFCTSHDTPESNETDKCDVDCKNIKEFKWRKRRKKKKCSWVIEKQNIDANICNEIARPSNIKVEDFCPMVCKDVCKEREMISSSIAMVPKSNVLL